ncbi:Aldo/keto reductase [Dendrothele bispora CBS 962.96]|uniref:Aldo/keto reductase n=1 Tax=Dendrothele bispora (strain CBS 962.96) TaxID=1314807 RepID=A0A4V4HGR4_DENBC|nr:Aldo/keto reductase [Dendrothele bispora CBS 962.96]
MSASKIDIPTRELNNGVEIPGVALGGFGGFTEEEILKAKDWFKTALKVGYRFIDTGQIYGTERVLGEAIKESGLKREEVTVLTKLAWHRGGDVRKAFEESLEKLGTDWTDIYLLHFPQCVEYEGGIEPACSTILKNFKVVSNPHFSQVWSDIEKIYLEGMNGRPRVKAIGVSNFSVKTLDVLLKTARVVPAVNQVEMSPYLAQNDLVEYCKEKGILLMAYSPSGTDTVRNDPTIKSIAEKHNTSPNQVILAWHVTRGVVPVPKSTDEGRQKGNLELPVLSPEDMKALDGLDRNERMVNKIGEDGMLFGWTKEQYGWI